MRTYREGFTLVEMLVTIVAASLVTLVTMTIMLTGIRMESKASADAVGQNNTRLFASVLDDVEGIAENTDDLKLYDIVDWAFPQETDENEDVPECFVLVSSNKTPLLLFSYDNNMKAGQFTLSTGTVLLDGVKECTVTKSDSLLKISTTTEDGRTYNFAVHLHVSPQDPQPE